MAEAAKQLEIDEAKTDLSRSGGGARLATLGSLKGKIVLSSDWDSPETNAAIAKDFS